MTERVLSDILKSRGIALFLDIDGTLVDIAPTPDAVVVPPGLPDELERLCASLDGALALVSGRTLDEIDRLIPVGLDAAGSHGLEWRQGGSLVHSRPNPAEAVSAALDGLRAELAAYPDLVYERKRYSFALHYRSYPDLGDELRRMADRACATLGDEWRVQCGKMVVEVLCGHSHKGDAIRQFMAQKPYADRVPVFAGDDLTDEEGFAAVNAMGGVSIAIGERETARAHLHLESPARLRDWLVDLAETLGGLAA